MVEWWWIKKKGGRGSKIEKGGEEKGKVRFIHISCIFSFGYSSSA
jgi:hypothetical protein